VPSGIRREAVSKRQSDGDVEGGANPDQMQGISMMQIPAQCVQGVCTTKNRPSKEAGFPDPTI
jgi:hypothetical protein